MNLHTIITYDMIRPHACRVRYPDERLRELFGDGITISAALELAVPREDIIWIACHLLPRAIVVELAKRWADHVARLKGRAAAFAAAAADAAAAYTDAAADAFAAARAATAARGGTYIAERMWQIKEIRAVLGKDEKNARK